MGGDLAYVAWRLLERAQPHRIAVSAEFWAAAKANFCFVELSGLPGIGSCYGMIENYSVCPLSDEISPWVGGSELVQHVVGLRQGAENSSMLLLSGDKGSGKSRLIREALRAHEVTNEAAIVLNSSSQQECAQRPFHTIINVLRQFLGREQSEELPDAIRRASLDDTPDAIVSLISYLLTPDEVAGATLTTLPIFLRKSLVDIFARLVSQCLHENTVWIWKDIHWADASSLDVLEQIMRRAEGGLFVIATTTEFVAGRCFAGCARITLPVLTLGESCDLLRHHCPDITEEMLLDLAATGNGNPLYLEELALFYRSAQVSGGDMPVQGSQVDAVLSRMFSFRTIAEIAAVLGDNARHDWLLELVDGGNENVEAQLAEAVAQGVLCPQSAQSAHSVYGFRHALLRQAVLSRQDVAERRELHARIAVMMIERYPQFSEKRPEVVAYHLGEAGLARGATDWWIRAARQAMWFGALHEACNQYREALRMLKVSGDDDLRTELGIQLELGIAAQESLGYGAPESKCVYQRALVLAEQIGDEVGYFHALRGMSVCSPNESYTISLHARRELLSLALKYRRPRMLPIAHCAVAEVLVNFGKLDSACRHLQAAYDSCLTEGVDTICRKHDGIPHLTENLGCLALSRLSFAAALLGHSERSAEYFSAGLSLARDTERPENEGLMFHCAGLLALLSSDYASLKSHADDLAKTAARHDLNLWSRVARFFLAVAEGKIDEFSAHIQRSSNVSIFPDYPRGAPYFVIGAARRLAERRDFTGANALLPYLRQSIAHWGVFLLAPYYLALSGRLDSHAGRHTAACRKYRWALTWARRHGYQIAIEQEIARLRAI
ncbi:MAG: hypothetical protein A3H93_16600 [Rhodocyclales bacterium RIFCSPLOWO2_02_FULL_63_24]|nr:MAG: hypothetical protein A3H93_16600 [Rhodocyclales bacterium RIFCSPLOWO2_02_FULL_63_24]